MEITLHRQVVIILEIEVIQSGEDAGGKIGDPTPYTEGKASQLIIFATFRKKTDINLNSTFGGCTCYLNAHQPCRLDCSVCSRQMFLVGPAKGPQSAPRAAESRPPLQPQNKNEGMFLF